MATASGVLIAESLQIGATVEDVPLVVDKVVRADVGDVGAGRTVGLDLHRVPCRGR